MTILIASDKWKGSLSANEACAAMARGVGAVFPHAEIVIKPIADGGEGTVEVAATMPGSRRRRVQVHGPLGHLTNATYVLLPNGDAVIEMAAAAGLALLKTHELDPWRANTLGVGESIVDAIAQGAKRVIVGLGGSATNDGGGGMAQALGWELAGVEHWPRDWEHLEAVKAPATRHQIDVVAASDVTNPLLGPHGCTNVFGPQKGINAEDFEPFETALASLASFFPAELIVQPRAGAAGGLGWGLIAFCGAQTVSGFDFLAELTGLDAAVRAADLVVTGEGSLDAQTLNGKGPHGVAEMAHCHGKQVCAVGGCVTDAARPAFDFCLAVTPSDMPLHRALRQAETLIERTICEAKHELLRLAP